MKLAALPVLILLATATAHADPAPRMLTAGGNGEVRGVPDQAELSTGVVTQGRTAAAALSANARAMTAVFAALKAAGIAEKDIQTTNVSVAPQYTDAKPGQPPHIASYEVTDTVHVTVHGLDRLGVTIDALVSAGSNQVDGPNFSIADPKPLLAQAREEAVKDATAKAEALARAAGVTLGPILSINESGGYAPPQPMSRAMAFAADKISTPVAAGEQSVSASVSITWEIR